MDEATLKKEARKIWGHAGGEVIRKYMARALEASKKGPKIFQKIFIGKCRKVCAEKLT